MSFENEMDDIELKRLALELEQIEKEIHELDQTGKPIILSEDLDAKMVQMIQEFESKEKKKKKQISVKKFMRLAAVIMICVTASLGVITINVDAFRIKLFDIIGKDHGEYMDINIVEKGEISPAIKEKFPEDWDCVFYPMELPEGFNLKNTSSMGSLKTLFFANKNDYPLSLEFSPIGEWSKALDSEDSDVDKIKVNDKEALFTTKDGCNSLVWADNGYEFKLTTYDLKIKETVKIAESIVFINLK